jgi:hypothetical protein
MCVITFFYSYFSRFTPHSCCIIYDTGDPLICVGTPCMGGSALHKASTYKDQYNVEDTNVSMASIVFENASSVSTG